MKIKCIHICMPQKKFPLYLNHKLKHLLLIYWTVKISQSKHTKLKNCILHRASWKSIPIKRSSPLQETGPLSIESIWEQKLRLTYSLILSGIFKNTTYLNIYFPKQKRMTLSWQNSEHCFFNILEGSSRHHTFPSALFYFFMPKWKLNTSSNS